MEYYSAIKIMPFVVTSIDCRDYYYTKSSKLHGERQIYDIAYMWNLKRKKKKKIRMNASPKHQETRRKQIYGYKRKGVGGKIGG